jgi:hypothetical protein
VLERVSVVAVAACRLHEPLPIRPRSRVPPGLQARPIQAALRNALLLRK